MLQLKDEVTKLSQNTEDLEGRQCRCNISILGIKEQLEAGSRPTHLVTELLQEALGLDTTLTLDRADCSLQLEPVREHQPRAFIVKLHYYQEKLEVLRRVARVSQLTYNSDKIMISATHCCETQSHFQRSKGASAPLPGREIRKGISHGEKNIH